MALLHRSLELREVELEQGALVHARVDLEAVADQRAVGPLLALLVVRGEVLDVRDHTLCLEAADPLHAEPGREERVLAEALERAPPERRAQDVDRRGVGHVVALELGLVADQAAVAARQRSVEARGQRERRGQRGARSLPHPHRPVGQVERRQVQARHAVPHPRVGSGSPEHAAGLVTAEQVDPLGRGQRVEQQVGPLPCRERGVAPRMGAAASSGLGRGARPGGQDHHRHEDQSPPHRRGPYPVARASRARWRSGRPAPCPPRRASRRCCAGACAPCSWRARARARSACRPCPPPAA